MEVLLKVKSLPKKLPRGQFSTKKILPRGRSLTKKKEKGFAKM